MKKLIVIILAAGKGSRMQSDTPKVLHKLNNKTLIERVISISEKMNPEKIIIVIGHQRNKVKSQLTHYKNLEFVIQKEQKGTGHAIKMCLPNLKNFNGDVIILSGDVPLITYNTLTNLIDVKNKNDIQASLLTAFFEDPSGYGRIIRNKKNMLDKIVEHKDCNSKELNINEINAGIYVFNNKMLSLYIPKITNENNQNEFYLPDIIKLMRNDKHYTGIYLTNNIEEIKGINTKEQLIELNAYIKKHEKE